MMISVTLLSVVATFGDSDRLWSWRLLATSPTSSGDLRPQIPGNSGARSKNQSRSLHGKNCSRSLDEKIVLGKSKYNCRIANNHLLIYKRSYCSVIKRALFVNSVGHFYLSSSWQPILLVGRFASEISTTIIEISYSSHSLQLWSVNARIIVI